MPKIELEKGIELTFNSFLKELKNKTLRHNYGLFNYFQKRIKNTYKFNLDEESLFLEFKTKLMNG